MKKELTVNTGLFLFTCICYFYLIPTYTASLNARNDFGPQMFPQLAIAVTGIASLLQVIQSCYITFRNKQVGNTDDVHGKHESIWRYMQAFVYVFVYFLSVTYIGFYSSTFALGAIYFRKMEKKVYLINLVTLCVLFLIIWFMFEDLMKVSLPTGLLI